MSRITTIALLLGVIHFGCNPKLSNKLQPKAMYIDQYEFIGLDTDILGNKYLYSEYELIKIKTNGDTIPSFNTLQTSSFTSVSVSNPNKVLVFSKDNQTVWILDNTLSIIDQKSLVDQPFGDVSYVESLDDNNLVYYSRSEKKIYKVSPNDKLIWESDIIWDFEGEITQILDSEDRIILRSSNDELFLFDSFGTFDKKLKSPREEGPMFLKNSLLFQMDGRNLVYLNLEDPTGEEKTYQLSKGSEQSKDFSIRNKDLYTLINGRINEETLLIVNY